MKVALHKVTIFPGCDFTPWTQKSSNSKSKSVLDRVFDYSSMNDCVRLIHKFFSPPFGSNAAWSARDGTVYMRQVGVVSCVVPSTNLRRQSSVSGLDNLFQWISAISSSIPELNSKQNSVVLTLERKPPPLKLSFLKLCVSFNKKAKYHCLLKEDKAVCY